MMNTKVFKCFSLRTGTDDAGCCVERYPCRMETCGTEEPDEGNPHVRICGGIGRAIADSTRTSMHERNVFGFMLGPTVTGSRSH